MKYKLTIEFDSDRKLLEFHVKDALLFGRRRAAKGKDGEDLREEILENLANGSFNLEKKTPIVITYTGPGPQSVRFFTTPAEAATFLWGKDTENYHASVIVPIAEGTDISDVEKNIQTALEKI